MERKQRQRLGLLLVCIALVFAVGFVTMPDGPMGDHSHVFTTDHPIMVKIAELEKRIERLEKCRYFVPGTCPGEGKIK